MIEILLMIWVLFAAIGLGTLFLRLFPNQYSPVEHFLFSAGLGFGAIAYLMMVLGFLDLWYTSVAYGLVITLSILGISNIKSLAGQIGYQGKKRTGNSWSKFSVLVGLILLAHVLVNLIGDLAPPLNGDTIGGYLVWPKIWVEHHGIVEFSENPFSFMPANAQMLSSLGLLLKSDVLSQLLVGFLMSVLSGLAVYSIARRNFSKEISLSSVAIFYCTPVMIWLVYSAKVDLLAAFFELLAFCAFLNFFFEEDECSAFKWIMLSAAFSGFSVGTKYLAYASVIIGGGVLIRYFRAGERNSNILEYVKYATGFALIVLLVGCPWYIRNIISHSNPIYPLLSPVSDIMLQFLERSEGEGICGYLTTFWSWSTQNPYMGKSIGPIFLFSIPFLLFMGKIDRRIIVLLAVVVAHSLLCYMVVSRPRHMLSGIGLLSIIAGYSVVRMREKQKILKYGVTAVVIGMLLFNFSLDMWRNLLSTPKIPYIFGKINREDFLKGSWTEKASLTYPMMKYINNKLPPNARILIIGPFWAYYIDRSIVGGWDCVVLKDEAEIAPYLTQKGATHIFVNPNINVKGEKDSKKHISSLLQSGDILTAFRTAFLNSPLFSKSFTDKHLKLLFSHGGKYLFEFIPESKLR